MDIVLYNNNFIIFGVNDSANYVIPLLGPFTPSPTFTQNANSNNGLTSVGNGGGSGSGTGGTGVTVGVTTTKYTSVTGAGGTAGATGATGAAGTGGTAGAAGAGGAGGASGSGGNGSGCSNSLLDNVNLDANGNVNNLNDYMAKNTLIGSNVYVSPMNNTGLYVPPSQTKQFQYSKRKINSSFNPSVDFS